MLIEVKEMLLSPLSSKVILNLNFSCFKIVLKASQSPSALAGNSLASQWISFPRVHLSWLGILWPKDIVDILSTSASKADEVERISWVEMWR